MKVFTNKEFNGHWPVGTAAIVIADDVEMAKRLLDEKLLERGLSACSTDQFVELDINLPEAIILCDGNY